MEGMREDKYTDLGEGGGMIRLAVEDNMHEVMSLDDNLLLIFGHWFMDNAHRLLCDLMFLKENYGGGLTGGV